MITLIHGPAELLRAETITQLRAVVSEDQGLAELNTAVLDGRQISLADLQFACGAMPFLAERRLVIVERLLARLATAGKGRGKDAEGESAAGTESGGGQTKAWLAVLDEVPETTDLVLVEDDTVSSGAFLRRLVELQRKGQASVVVCEKPKRGDLQAWIRERARKRDLQLDAAAITDLADFVGDDLRSLDQELIKLRDYVAGQRPVTQADVRRVVPATRAANVFEMVDLLAAGNAVQAGRMLRHALDADGEQPLGLLALFGRRYRQLIQVKVLQSEGMSAGEIAGQLGVADWQVRKLLEQSKSQSLARLRRALEYLLGADESIKTGRCTDREAMDILLAQLAGDGKRKV